MNETTTLRSIGKPSKVSNPGISRRRADAIMSVAASMTTGLEALASSGDGCDDATVPAAHVRWFAEQLQAQVSQILRYLDMCEPEPIGALERDAE